VDRTTETAGAGLALGLGAYLVWGLLPAFLKLLADVPAPEVLAHRVLWSGLLLAILVLALGRWAAVLAAFRSPRVAVTLVATAVLIGANWLFYIWAVNSGQVLETSLGYFINPLLNVALGVVVLGERLGRVQLVAVLFAAAGVAYLAVAQGSLPLVSLALAGTFGLYGLLRKMAPVDPLSGLFAETIILAPAALAYVLYLGETSSGAFGAAPRPTLLLMLSGLVTAAPLLMFAAAGKRLRYATLGLLQYLAPTLQFSLAIFAFGETLGDAHLVAFGLIWAGLAIFATDAVRTERRRRLARA